MHSPQARQKLLQLARTAISEILKGGTITSRPLDPDFSEPRGAFVTLRKRGELRGCIGRFESDLPLDRTVAEMAVAAAFHDPRFPPLTREELGEIEIEISVLSPLRRVTDFREIRVGEHGLVVSRGPYRGVLLPQVATEEGWDRETFLGMTCRKAGLSFDSWKQPDIEIQIFSAEVFGERDLDDTPTAA